MKGALLWLCLALYKKTTQKKAFWDTIIFEIGVSPPQAVLDVFLLHYTWFRNPSSYLLFITSAKVAMFVGWLVLVGLIVCKIMQKLLDGFQIKKNGGKIGNGPRTKPLKFGVDKRDSSEHRCK